ncbi:MAG: NAD(P)/FAD-dependent oxidoreductase [Bacteroidota bacterium]
MQSSAKRCVIIGGGAAGFFGANRIAELSPGTEVIILERSSRVLDKVRISGGGRCNLTHACFDPRELIQNYPRGGKALLGPFTRFGPADTMEWFESRGVEVKTESDGRVFPECDDSAAVVNALRQACERNGVTVRTGCGIKGVEQRDKHWICLLEDGSSIEAQAVLIAAGSSPQVWRMLVNLGLQMHDQVPSLFTFHIRDKALQNLAGVAMQEVVLDLIQFGFKSRGPLLFTHWGVSGPAVLKLSAFAARNLAESGYQAELRIDFLPAINADGMRAQLMALRTSDAKKCVATASPFPAIPKRAWWYLVERSGIDSEKRWADCSNTRIDKLASELKSALFKVNGKSTFKDEFVTCGGVSLDEIDTKTFGARRFPGLYLAGEVLDVDAVTGGFNFQHAWTSSWLAAESISAFLSQVE